MNVSSASHDRRHSIDSDPADTARTSQASGAPTTATVKEPDWERMPSVVAEHGAAGAASKDLKPKLERLVKDVQDLQAAVGPYTEHVQQLMHAVNEIKEAAETIEQTAHHAYLAPFALLALHRALHAVPEAKHAFEGMLKEAPGAAARAKPILERIFRDLQDLQASTGHPGPLPPAIERGVHVCG